MRTVRFTDGQVGICEKPRNDARIRDADGNRRYAVTDVLETAIWANDGQRAFVDELSEESSQQRHINADSDIPSRHFRSRLD